MLAKKVRVKKLVRLVGFTAAVVVVVALNSYRSFGSSDGPGDLDEVAPSATEVHFDPDILIAGGSLRLIQP